MSWSFCILIPSKILQIDKHFQQKLQAWFTDNYPDILPYYSLLSLSEFGNRPNINLNLPEKLYSRYRVVDWNKGHIKLHILQTFLLWLAEIYVYGEVGLLHYWSGSQHYDVTVGNFEGSLSNLPSTGKLPLDEIVFVPLSNYSSRSDELA